MYDDQFYLRYAKYLSEPRVRAVHDRMLAMLTTDQAFRRVIDLGCGKSYEFFYHAQTDLYIGFDMNPGCLTWEVGRTKNPGEIIGFSVKGNYRDELEKVKSLVDKFRMTAIVSLFSVENTASPEENQKYYERLFVETQIEAILTSGFYYEGSTDPVIEEAGDLHSYQSFAEMPSESSVYSEVRSLVRCPSDLFGEKPVEVWRLLRRRSLDEISRDRPEG